MPDVSPIGFLNVDKPLRVTSHDVVARARRAFRLKKVGHAGTLDPLATGVLVLCVGAATRLSEYVLHTTKHYRARLHLGVSTDTYDAEGQIVSQREIGHITHKVVEQALAQFTGEIAQIPPMYSAVKQGGRKLYELARAGLTVEREARRVTIHRLEVVDWTPPECALDVMCSAGTYIRSLAHDLGEALGVGAHLAGLVRTASGAFTLEDALPLDDLLATLDWTRHIIPVEVGLASMPRLTVDAVNADQILHGRSIPVGDDASEGELRRTYGPDGAFFAIVQAKGSHWRPHKVFLP